MFNNPIPKFTYSDNKLVVVKPGYVEGFALYEGNRIVLSNEICDSSFDSEGGLIAIVNKNTNEIMLGTIFGGHLVVIPSFHPISEKHWHVLGSVIAVERRLEDAYVGKEQWFVSTNGSSDNVTNNNQPVSSIYLSEYAKIRQHGSISLLASTTPMTTKSSELLSKIPKGCIWFLIPDLAVQSEMLPQHQRWSILGRQRRCSKWKKRRNIKTAGMYRFPLSVHNEKNPQEFMQGAKLASK